MGEGYATRGRVTRLIREPRNEQGQSVDEFRDTQAGMPRPGVEGWWENVIPHLDESRVGSLMDAASDRTISHRTIATVLGRWGFTVTPAQVGHWRRNYVG